MRFRLIVTDERGEEWTEDEDRADINNMDDATAWAVEIMQRFNDTLRPHERARTLVRVEPLPDGEGETGATHDWEKTNLVTVMHKYFGSHDTMKCKNCGITGKRFGLGPQVAIDSDFKAAGFLDCARAYTLMERRRKKKAKTAITPPAETSQEPENERWEDSVAYLTLTSFEGVLAFASHYYATIKYRDEEHDVEHKLSSREAADMNKTDGRSGVETPWSPGDSTSRYRSKDDAIKHALLTWRELVPNAKVLILGSLVYSEPQPILDGLSEIAKDLNDLHQQCEDLGWWDGSNKPDVLAATQLWEELINNALMGDAGNG